MILHSRSGTHGAFIAIGIALVAGAIFSTAVRACPDTIAVTQSAAGVGDWQVRDTERNQSSKALLFTRDRPNNRPRSSTIGRSNGNPKSFRWNLPPSKEGYWLACGYSNTSKQLYRKLPVMTATCGVTFDRGVNFPDGSPLIRRVRCLAK
jgi:hypothetical protein